MAQQTIILFYKTAEVVQCAHNKVQLLQQMSQLSCSWVTAPQQYKANPHSWPSYTAARAKVVSQQDWKKQVAIVWILAKQWFSFDFGAI